MDRGVIDQGVTSVSFTPLTWNIPQTLTVRGVDDSFADGDTSYRVDVGPTVSSDANYVGLMGTPNITLINVDDDVAGVIPNPLRATVSEDGGSAVISWSLQSKPRFSVFVNLGVSNLAELSLSGLSNPLVFTEVTWSTPQSMTVTGVDDSIIDGNTVSFVFPTSVTSADPTYQSLSGTSCAVTNVDNDIPLVTVLPVISGGKTSENGTVLTFQVRLGARPSSFVSFNVSSSDLSEATITPNSFVFSPINYQIWQFFNVTGVDDDEADGPIGYNIVISPTFSSDIFYNGIITPFFPLINDDNDIAEIIFSDIFGELNEENKSIGIFYVKLGAKPNNTVILPVISNNRGKLLVVDPNRSENNLVSTLSFSPANWNVSLS